MRGLLEYAIGIFENILIDLGGKTLLEIFVKYEKIGRHVGHTLDALFEAGLRTQLVYLLI